MQSEHMNRSIAFPASDTPPHSVIYSWMLNHENKPVDDHALFVIGPNEASAIVCYDDVFGHFLVICQGDKKQCTEWAHRYFGDELINRNFEIETNGKACHYRGVTANTCLIWMEVPSENDGGLIFALLAHEAVHYAYAIMDLRGIIVSDENEEFVAYYVQWVMSNYLQCVGLQSEDHSKYKKEPIDGGV